jgi:uncharacterized protein (TIGR03067 family)
MLTTMTTLAVLAFSLPSQDKTPLEGKWVVYMVETKAEGATMILNTDYVLTVNGDKFTFKHLIDGQEGTTTGDLVIDTKAGKLDLVGAKGTMYCAYRLEKDTLTLAVWHKAEDRQGAPSTDKSGLVFMLGKVKKVN